MTSRPPAATAPGTTARATAAPLLLTGALSSVLYVVNVILGGLITPGYSHVRNAVSELTQAGAPHAATLGVLYLVSGLLLVAFGVAVCLEFRHTSRRAFAGGVLLLVFALQGLLLATIFPQDPIGAPLTFPGTMHLVLVGVSVLLIVAAILLIGFGVDRRQPRWRHFRAYSVVTVILMFAGGVATPILASSDIEALGLAERITQLAYLAWFTVFSLQAYAASVERVRGGM